MRLPWSTSDGAGDERPSFLGQQLQEAFLLRYQRIQPRRFALQVIGNSALLWYRMHGNRDVCKVRGIDLGIVHAHGTFFHFCQESRLPQCESAITGIESVFKRADHCKTGGDDEVVRWLVNLCDRLQIRPHRRNDHVTVPHKPAGAAWSILEPV